MNQEDVPTTGSENRDEDCKHPQKLSSESETTQTRLEEEGSSLRGVTQGLLVCVHWRDGKNIGDMNK